MTLHYEFGEIENFREKCFEKRGEHTYVAPKAELLVFATVVIGLNHLNEDNIREWVFRMRFAAKVLDAYWGSALDTHKVTTEDLRPYIGLATNAERRTRASWIRLAMRRLEARIEEELE